MLSVDEKSQIQALDRTQPGLPMKKLPRSTSPTAPSSALNVQRHATRNSSDSSTPVEAQVPVGNLIHAIVDNYATHKHPKVRQWLRRHSRSTFHFTPTSASWLNAVEGFFAKLTKRRLKRGVFASVVDLRVAINRFVLEHNAKPKPFTRTADPNKIIQAVSRGHQALNSIH